MTEQELQSALEAMIYAADEPATLDQLVAAITGEKPRRREVVQATSQDASDAFAREQGNELIGENGVDAGASAAADALSEAATENAQDCSAESNEPVRGVAHAALRAEIRVALDRLVASYAADERGIEIRKVAGGWKMYTKPQHHEAVRRFIKSLRPPVRLTMPALETLSVIAYKQPVTLPEINEIRGVNCGGVVKTLLERRLITTAGRKEAVGRPILYRTSKDFLMRFGLADLEELPSLKEFEQLAQQALGADEGIAPIESDESAQEIAAADSAPDSAAPADSNEVTADSGSASLELEQGPNVTPESKAATSSS